MASAHKKYCVVATFVLLLLTLPTIGADLRSNIVTDSETKIAEFHAEGAQIYECKADKSGKLTWQFREPIASLMINGETVGRHYTGPNWELEDGSAVVGRVIGRAPGETPEDVPWLKLKVISQRGIGALTGVTTVQRVETKGGVATGGCHQVGSFVSVPYTANYIFLKKS